MKQVKNNNLPCGVNRELCPLPEINQEMKEYSISELLQYCGQYIDGGGFRFIMSKDENGKDLLDRTDNSEYIK